MGPEEMIPGLCLEGLGTNPLGGQEEVGKAFPGQKAY